MDRAEWMKEELKRIRGVTELPKELLEKMERCMPSGEPVTISIINFMTTEEMDREEERVRAELWEKLENLVEEDSDGELMIYRGVTEWKIRRPGRGGNLRSNVQKKRFLSSRRTA